MNPFDTVVRFFISVLLISGLVYWGYHELCQRKESIVGLSTWAFAFLPFLGLLGGIAGLEYFWLPIRGGVVIALIVASRILMPKLFNKARARFR